MSSKCLVESCSEAQAEGRGLEERQGDKAGKEAAEAPCEDKRPAGSSGIREATSRSGLEPVQREEKARENPRVKAKEGFSHISVDQERRHRGSAPGGAAPVKQCIWRPFTRGLPTCSDPDREQQRRAEEPRGLGPFYFIGGANGAEIVSSYCESRGWKRIYNKHRDDVKLMWCESKSRATYCNFKEGEQLVYQIPNNKVLTTKIGLLSSLRQYERVRSKVNHGQGLRLKLKMKEFIPTTFRMDLREEREAFFAQQEGVSNSESHMWICKPTGLNQGKGIFLLKSQEDVAAFRLKLEHTEDILTNGRTHHRQPQAQIVQHYIQKPLLLKGKKFDVRSYLLIACTAPYVVFFCHGYVRLTCDLYDPSSNNMSAHLTNQCMQKKNPLYSQLKEDTVWSMESFNAYVNDSFRVAKGLPRDWVLGAFAKRMQRIMTQCFLAVKSKFDCRLGFFDLIGCDFMVDEDFKVWLLEMNCNPALHTNCIVLKEVIPSIVVETLDISLEIFNKCRANQRILPLASQRDFVLLYNKVFRPDSVLVSSKSYTNREFNRKSVKKTEPKRCKTAGNNASSSSLDSVKVSASGEGRGSSKSGQSPSACTALSRFQQNSSSVQGPSHLLSGCNSRTDRTKDPSPRVDLKPSKCAMHQYSKGDVKNSKSMKATRTMSPSSPRITSLVPGVPVSGFPETTTPFPPHAGPPPLRGKKRALGEEKSK